MKTSEIYQQAWWPSGRNIYGNAPEKISIFILWLDLSSPVNTEINTNVHKLSLVVLLIWWFLQQCIYSRWVQVLTACLIYTKEFFIYNQNQDVSHDLGTSFVSHPFITYKTPVSKKVKYYEWKFDSAIFSASRLDLFCCKSSYHLGIMHFV